MVALVAVALGAAADGAEERSDHDGDGLVVDVVVDFFGVAQRNNGDRQPAFQGSGYEDRA